MAQANETLSEQCGRAAQRSRFLRDGDTSLTRRLATRLRGLRPRDPEWPDRLAGLDRSSALFGPVAARPAAARRALVEYETAGRLARQPNGLPPPDDLSDAAEIAILAGDDGAARK